MRQVVASVQLQSSVFAKEAEVAAPGEQGSQRLTMRSGDDGKLNLQVSLAAELGDGRRITTSPLSPKSLPLGRSET